LHQSELNEGDFEAEEGGIALFLQGYQVVLGVKGARADPRGLRQTLDASAATWTDRLGS